MGVLIGKWSMAQTAVSLFRCSTACPPQPVALTPSMAWAAFLKCHSKAERKAVTSSKVHLPSYVGRLDDLTEMPQLLGGTGVGLAEPQRRNKLEVSLETRQILHGPRGSWEGLGARVTCTWLVVSH